MMRCSRCKGQNGRAPQRYCHACHAEHQRRTRRRHGELSPVQRAKANTRSYTNVMVRRGVMRKRPCVACGASRAQAHHPDYAKPRMVVWLCAPCHRVVHR